MIFDTKSLGFSSWSSLDEDRRFYRVNAIIMVDILRVLHDHTDPFHWFFSRTCLLSWLEQDISCPICRVSLRNTFDHGDQRLMGGRRAADGTSRFFTFEGSRFQSVAAQCLRDRYVCHSSARITRRTWEFSINETSARFFYYFSGINSVLTGCPFLYSVSHPLPEYMESGSSIEVMAEQVRQVFPHVSQHAIIQDLLETGSPEMTIENILSGAVDVTAQPVRVDYKHSF